MDKWSWYLTVFITSWGLFEWGSVPFGLMNAPAVFLRFMTNGLVDYGDQFPAPYLDDVLVYSKSFEDHVNHLQLILQQFRDKRIKWKPSMCKFFQKQVKLLGNIATAESYKVDPSLTEPITKFLGDPPKDIAGIRRLLCLLGYFHRHIQSFSSVARPLDLLINPVSGNKPVVNKSLIEWGEKNTK